MGIGGVLNAVLRQKYFPEATFFEARLGLSPSYTWRSIWEARDLLVAGIRWQVGDGNSILILGIHGSHDPQPFSLSPVLPHFEAIRQWNRSLQLIKIGMKLLSEPNLSSRRRIVACDMRIGGSCPQLGRSWSFIWSSKALPKVMLFAWKCAMEPLPTSVNLKRRGVLVDEECGGCLATKKDVLHVL
ncbi:UNVERIFIED_CONTAM: hypothetical protein Slati_4153900 [Sesamum latifolium]|uniref:Reverse transcriptase zinc-binding domain-containing protein n=1 Tax=Sesamum latifolium TaxID=2727402 RepID=A0AAW2T968_9LAMI